MIKDYDSISKQFVASTEKMDQELILINESGKIIDTIPIALEWPNAIQGIFSISFRNSEIQIFDSRTGFYFLSSDGEIQSKIPLRYNYLFITSRVGQAFYPTQDGMAYLRPTNTYSLGG